MSDFAKFGFQRPAVLREASGPEIDGARCIDWSPRVGTELLGGPKSWIAPRSNALGCCTEGRGARERRKNETGNPVGSRSDPRAERRASYCRVVPFSIAESSYRLRSRESVLGGPKSWIAPRSNALGCCTERKRDERGGKMKPETPLDRGAIHDSDRSPRSFLPIEPRRSPPRAIAFFKLGNAGATVLEPSTRPCCCPFARPSRRRDHRGTPV